MKESILVVEDESIVAMDIRNCLVGHGYDVVDCVPSGEEAVAVAGEIRPNLVLMDIRLAGEMTGIEAARRIQESFGIPSLFLTSYVDAEMLRQAKGLNAVGYVLKPFDERELAVAVEMALHRWQVESGLRQALQEATGGQEKRGAADSEPSVPELLIRTLGRLELSVQGRVVARAEDLSRSLRNLLCLMLTSPQMRLSKDDIQLSLWPESPPEKGRSSFDSLLLRLRKTMDEHLHPLSITDYLSLQRGILCLKNCRCDAIEFLLAARRGLEFQKRSSPAEARDAFVEALRWWDGPFLPGVSEVERLHDFKETLERLYVDVVLGKSGLLMADGAFEPASQLLSQALTCDRTNDSLVRALYNCYLAANKPAKAGEVLRQYEEALHRAGFGGREIREILEGYLSGGKT